MEVNGSPFCTQNALSFLLFFLLVSPLQQHLRWRVLSPFSVTLPFRRQNSLNHRETASNGEPETAGSESTWRDDSLEREQKKTLVGKQKEKTRSRNKQSRLWWRMETCKMRILFLIFFFAFVSWMICWNWNYQKQPVLYQHGWYKGVKGIGLYFTFVIVYSLYWVMIYLPDIHKCRNRRVVAIWASESIRVIRAYWGRWNGCRPCKCDCRTTWCANLSV